MEENEVVDNSTETVENNDIRAVVEQAIDNVEQQQEQPQQEQPQETQQQEQPERNPFNSWKKEAQAELAKLPETTKKFIQEREEQFHRGLEQYKEQANYAKDVQNALKPYDDYLKQFNVPIGTVVKSLIKTEHTLRSGSPAEKVEMVQKLVKDYGIDINQVLTQPYDAERVQYKQQLANMQSQLQAYESMQNDNETSQIYATLQDFGAKHEFYEDVRNDMADLIEKGLANSLDDAYNKAIRLNDNVFNKAQARQANQAAKQAKAAAVSVKGSPLGVQSTSTPKTTEEAVRMAMANLGL